MEGLEICIHLKLGIYFLLRKNITNSMVNWLSRSGAIKVENQFLDYSMIIGVKFLAHIYHLGK